MGQIAFSHFISINQGSPCSVAFSSPKLPNGSLKAAAQALLHQSRLPYPQVEPA